MWVGAILVKVLASGPAAAQSMPGDSMGPGIQSLKAGIICAQDVISLTPAPDTVAGVTNVIEGDPAFVAFSRDVPAVVGIGFGVKSQAADGIDRLGVLITVTHPPMGDAGVIRESYTTDISSSGLSFTLYQFDYDYELVQGTWTFEATHDGKRLFRASFDVVPPQDVPELAAACGYENLLS
jgi:hypothetical protein